MSVGDLIRDACREYASSTAVLTLREGTTTGACVREVEELTYAELYDRTLRCCDALFRAGVAVGDRVAVLADNCSALIISEWACLKTGFLWVALNARSSPEELAAILDDSRPAVLLVDPEHAALLESGIVPSDCRVIGLGVGSEWEALLAAAEPVEPSWAPDAETPVRIRYTSGTSGRPKGAVLPRRAYDASVEEVDRAIGPLQSTDTLLQIAPMTHASGAMWLPHVRVGARSVLLDRFDARAIIDLIEEYCVTAVFLVPTMLVRLLDVLDDPRKMTSLRTVVYGGASMPVVPLQKALRLLGRRFVQIYGLTESTWPITALLRDDHVVGGGEPATTARLASCGRPTPIGDLRIMSPAGKPVSAGETGEIHVRGKNTMLGYWHTRGRADVVDAKGLDEDGWMHTGDVGFMDDEGFVTIVDRLHDMIVSGGFNVYPKEVEHCLCRHEAVLEAAVVGLPDEEWGERVHASVVLRRGAAATEQELARHCAAKLAGFKKPRSVEIVEELPKNASGKILRREIRNRLAAVAPTPKPGQ